MNLETRTAQILAVTERERDEVDENNPIIHAETGPNRFASMSMFFTDEDGVRIEEDLAFNEVSVYYFNKEGEIAVEEGAFYEWAKDYFDRNWSN